MDIIETALTKARCHQGISLVVQWKDLPLNLKVSGRATRMRLQASGGQFFLIVPMTVRSKDIYCFLTEAEPWLHKQVHRVQQVAVQETVIWPDFLRSDSRLPFQGKSLLLQGHPQGSSSAYKWFPEQEILSVPWQPTESDALCPKQIRLFMVQEALKQATVWASEYATQLNLSPRSITMRQAKGRWGSLGIHNDMYLNWVLIFAPPTVFQYVVLHEMGHLRYRSHGPRFWKLVERYMPDYNEARRWLRCFGSQIMPPPHLGFNNDIEK